MVCSGQVLVNGPNHTIEGFNPSRSVGNNQLNIENEGLIGANVAGQTLVLDPNSSLVNRGTLAATDEGILRLSTADYVNEGTVLVETGAQMISTAATTFVQTAGELQVDGLLRVDNALELAVAGGALTGSGEVFLQGDSADLILGAATVSPGSDEATVGSLGVRAVVNSRNTSRSGVRERGCLCDGFGNERFSRCGEF